MPGAGQGRGGRVCGGVERDTLGGAARRVAAQVGPVPAVLDPQDVTQPSHRRARQPCRMASATGVTSRPGP